MISNVVENGSNSVISLVKDYPVVATGLTLFAIGTFFMMGKKEDVQDVDENPIKELKRDRIIGCYLKYPDRHAKKIFEKIDLKLNKSIEMGNEYTFNKDSYHYSWSKSAQEDLSGLASEFLLKTNRNSYKLTINNYTKYDATCDEAGYLLLDGFRVLSFMNDQSQNQAQWDNFITICPFKERADLLCILQQRGSNGTGDLIFLCKEKKGLKLYLIKSTKKFENEFSISEIESLIFERKIFEVFKSIYDEGSAFSCFPQEIIQLIAMNVISRKLA